MTECIYIFSYEIDLAGKLITGETTARCTYEEDAWELARGWLDEEYPHGLLLTLQMTGTREV